MRVFAHILLIGTFGGWALARPPTPTLQAPGRDPAAILAAAREALGGEKRLSGVKNFVATGRTRQVRGDNLDDQLRTLQTPITLGPGIIGSYDFNPSYGGPIKRDKIWFWGSYRKFSTAQGVEGIFANKFALDPTHWDYQKDTTISAPGYIFLGNGFRVPLGKTLSVKQPKQ